MGSAPVYSDSGPSGHATNQYAFQMLQLLWPLTLDIVVIGEELKPSPGKPTSSEDAEIVWIFKDEKAHGIIQDHISDALLMRTGDLTSSKELFDKLVSLHQTSNIAPAFYSFQQLTKLSWDGTSPI
ncbi:hypothetical protein SERLA73DRAFT_68425 [Serpula lacrymans var. lacrymans S7.3]|uniref:Uncharacterized protein n=2 Tax=Serpula lacrymans var. lacrymans TaxID=341189 RepID=F8PFU7_SERL3|nr:uncharacterized protein SERLADRAFT_432176 [Serpula lacrymans var. lacrymans S7.9]EGO04759.1 hypothetical protein SERLA73DRAFT_68425 [Serpula lacrymans var. lacrymans S7.3]EGO30604.1 hypothetical protein SERLADRAFT_432176 [Serpula lacrymans var. lacrymans S7.9]